MLSLKYFIGCLVVYFVGLYVFFTTEFVSYKQVEGISQKRLLEKPNLQQNEQRTHSSKQMRHNQRKKSQESSLQGAQFQQFPSVSQVILVIIDAYRYDYVNKTPFFTQTLKKYPQTTLLKKSLIGQPTMTTQRIQSMMTGSQIFSSSNILDMFLSRKKDVDNIIGQMHRYNKKVRIFGDDAWGKLFQVSEEDKFVCDGTFDIRDYEKCDKVVYDNLQRFVNREGDGGSQQQNKKSKVSEQTKNASKLGKQREQSQLLIAHFLSIDHIGHSTSSITSPEIEQHLQKISLYLEYLRNISVSDTMFIVTGDHGMRADGNHGGNSRQETESAVLFHYKGKDRKKERKQPQIKVSQEPQTKHSETFIEEFDVRKRIRGLQQGSINQIDLTPTLSILLNVPNPINSIGYPLIQMLPSKYTNYLSQIQYNVISQYQHIINNYQAEFKENSEQTLLTSQCLSKIHSLKTGLYAKQVSSDPIEQSFEERIRAKQYIKTEIQLTKCLYDGLSMVRPDGVMVGVALAIMAIGVIIVGSIVIGLQITVNSLCEAHEGRKSLKGIFAIPSYYRAMVIENLGWVLSLFSLYFSWYLIRNQSTYLLVLIFGVIMLMPTRLLPTKKKLWVMLLLLLMTQFQSEKFNQYEQNVLSLRIINALIDVFSYFTFSKLNKQQTSQILTTLRTFSICIWALLNIRSSVRSLKPSISSKSSKQPIKQNPHLQTFGSSSTVTQTNVSVMLRIFLLVLVMFLGIDEDGSQGDNEVGIIVVRWMLIIVGSVKAMVDGNSKKIGQPERLRETGRNLVFLMSPIYGHEHLLLLITYNYCLTALLMPQQNNTQQITHSKTQKKPQNSTLNSFQPNDKSPKNHATQTILISLIAEYMWWLLGNRYEYSSIDIKKSFVFSQNFIMGLNAAVLLFWYVSPFILAVGLVVNVEKDRKEGIERQGQAHREEIQQDQLKENSGLCAEHFQNESNTLLRGGKRLLFDPQQDKLKKLVIPTIITQLNLIKLTLIPLSGLFSACLNLFYNNGKILFTVVYVPLTILGIIKTVVIVSLVAVILTYRKLNRKN